MQHCIQQKIRKQSSNHLSIPWGVHFIHYFTRSVSVFIPALNFQVINIILTECVNKGAGQAGIRDQGYIIIYGASSDPVIVIKFILAMMLGNVDHKINFLLLDVINGIGLLIFIGPIQNGRIDAVLAVKIMGAFGSI